MGRRRPTTKSSTGRTEDRELLRFRIFCTALQVIVYLAEVIERLLNR